MIGEALNLGRELLAELRSLRAELRELRAELAASKFSGKANL